MKPTDDQIKQMVNHTTKDVLNQTAYLEHLVYSEDLECRLQGLPFDANESRLFIAEVTRKMLSEFVTPVMADGPEAA